MTDFRLHLDPDPDTDSQVVLNQDEILAFRLYERLTGQDPTLDRDKAELSVFAPDDSAPESVFATGHTRHTPAILGQDPVVQPPGYLRVLVTPPRLPEGVRIPDLINQPARLSLTDEAGVTRHVRGLIQRTLNRTGAYGRSAALELQIYPWLWAMALSQKCRVWTNVTSVEVLEQLVTEYALELPDAPRVDASALTGQPRRRDAVIQWHESDFEFVSRLLERDGIFLHFVHDEAITRIHLADTRSQGSSLHGDGRELRLIAGDQAGDELFADAVTHLTAQREAVPRQYTVADYNPVIADTPLRQSSPPEVATAQGLYDYPGEVTDVDEVSTAARRRYQAVMNRREIIHAAGRCPFLVPGSVHTAPSPWDPTEDDWELRITESVHELLRDESGKPVYRAWTAAIAGDEQFAPAQRTPIPSVEGTHNATVVSRSAETVDVDEHSRALVVFHWDPTRRPVRARLGQPWSGTAHGMHVLPRHGDEVMVGFVQGSAESPVILTNVHNSTTPKWLNPVQSRSDTFDQEQQAVPGPTRQNRYVTALHNSTGNQIAVSDEMKAEKVKIKAEKDFDLEVGHKKDSAGDFEGKKEKRGAAKIRTYGDLTIYVGKLTDSMTEYPASDHHDEVDVAGGTKIGQDERGDYNLFVMGGTSSATRGSFAYVTHPADGSFIEASYAAKSLFDDRVKAEASRGNSVGAHAGRSADMSASAGFDASLAFGSSMALGGSLGFSAGASVDGSLDAVKQLVTKNSAKIRSATSHAEMISAEETINATKIVLTTDPVGKATEEGIHKGFMTAFKAVEYTLSGAAVTACTVLSSLAGHGDKEDAKEHLQNSLPKLAGSLHLASATCFAANLLAGVSMVKARKASSTIEKAPRIEMDAQNGIEITVGPDSKLKMSENRIVSDSPKHTTHAKSSMRDVKRITDKGSSIKQQK